MPHGQRVRGQGVRGSGGQGVRGPHVHPLVGAEGQVGGVVDSWWCVGLVDGSSGEVEKISFLRRKTQPAHVYLFSF